MSRNDARKQPTIGEHLADARRQQDFIRQQSDSSKRLQHLLLCLENLTEAIQKLYQQITALRLRLEDLEDAAINRK